MLKANILDNELEFENIEDLDVFEFLNSPSVCCERVCNNDPSPGYATYIDSPLIDDLLFQDCYLSDTLGELVSAATHDGDNEGGDDDDEWLFDKDLF